MSVILMKESGRREEGKMVEEGKSSQGRDFHFCYSERHYPNTPVFYRHKGVTPSNEHAAVDANNPFQIGYDCQRGSGRGVYCLRHVLGQPQSFVSDSNGKGDCLHRPGLYMACSIRCYSWSDYTIRHMQSSLLFFLLAYRYCR